MITQPTIQQPRTIFVPATYASNGGSMASKGHYACVALDGLEEYGFITGQVPSEFSSLNEAVIGTIPVYTLASADWNIEIYYGAVGQSYMAHSGSITAPTYAVTANELFEIDISSGLTSLSANDYIGIRIVQATAGHSVQILGLRLKFNL